MNRTLKIIIGVILGIILLPVIIIGLPFILLFKGSSPQPPKIKYGEFPFKLVYEINGERVTVEDTLICEYDGIGWNEGTGKHRKWKSYLESNREERSILLLELEDHTKIYYSTYMPGYYMGDMGKGNSLNAPFNGVFAVGSSRSKLHAMDIKDRLEYLNIVLIEWEIAPPIENNFN